MIQSYICQASSIPLYSLFSRIINNLPNPNRGRLLGSRSFQITPSLIFDQNDRFVRFSRI